MNNLVSLRKANIKGRLRSKYVKSQRSTGDDGRDISIVDPGGYCDLSKSSKVSTLLIVASGVHGGVAIGVMVVI